MTTGAERIHHSRQSAHTATVKPQKEGRNAHMQARIARKTMRSHHAPTYPHIFVRNPSRERTGENGRLEAAQMPHRPGGPDAQEGMHADRRRKLLAPFPVC